MFVQLRGVKREGYPGVWAAGRFWPSSESLRVEIVDEDPPTIPQDLVENGKVVGQRQIQDMTKISKKQLAEVKEDGRITVMNDGETDVVATQEALDGARAIASDLSNHNDKLKAQVAELQKAPADLAAENAKLKAQVAELKATGSDIEEDKVHAELKSTNQKLASQLATVTSERDAALSRVATLEDKLSAPRDVEVDDNKHSHSSSSHKTGPTKR
jgi:chromosome segregation ATPase